MTNNKKLKSFLISIIFSCVLWLILTNLLFYMKIWEYFIIEFSIAVSYLFSKFVKTRMGIIKDNPF